MRHINKQEPIRDKKQFLGYVIEYKSKQYSLVEKFWLFIEDNAGARAFKKKTKVNSVNTSNHNHEH